MAATDVEEICSSDPQRSDGYGRGLKASLRERNSPAGAPWAAATRWPRAPQIARSPYHPRPTPTRCAGRARLGVGADCAYPLSVATRAALRCREEAPAPQPTCNPHRRAARIDNILVADRVEAAAEPIRAIDDHTPLPSIADPSNHMPITALPGIEEAVARLPPAN